MDKLICAFHILYDSIPQNASYNMSGFLFVHKIWQHSLNYAHDHRFVVLSCGLVPDTLTDILQGYIIWLS